MNFPNRTIHVISRWNLAHNFNLFSNFNLNVHEKAVLN